MNLNGFDQCDQATIIDARVLTPKETWNCMYDALVASVHSFFDSIPCGQFRTQSQVNVIVYSSVLVRCCWRCVDQHARGSGRCAFFCLSNTTCVFSYGFGMAWAGIGQAQGRHRADTGQTLGRLGGHALGGRQALGRHWAGTGQAQGRHWAGIGLAKCRHSGVSGVLAVIDVRFCLTNNICFNWSQCVHGALPFYQSHALCFPSPFCQQVGCQLLPFCCGTHLIAGRLLVARF